VTRRARWRSNLDASANQVDLLIDRAMDLEDRVRTAGSVIRRGGPANLMETALVQDAASRLSNATPERIVEYRPPRLGSAVRCYTSVGSSIVVAIAVLAAIIEYRLPSSRALDPATVAVMQTAGDELEQSTKAIEAGIKPGTPTATLAEQQADLARAVKNT